MPVYRSELFDTGLKERIFKENKSKEKNTIKIKDEEDINKDKIITKKDEEENINN